MTVSTWEDLLANTDVTAEITWTGGDLDFNDIQPQGFASTVEICGDIDFNGATFKNFQYRGMPSIAINFKTTNGISNLKLLDLFYSVIGGSGGSPVILQFTVGGSGYAYCDNCEFSTFIDSTSNAIKVINASVGNAKVLWRRWSIAVECSNSIGQISLCQNSQNSFIGFYDSIINCDVLQNGYTNIISCNLNNCLLKGKWQDNNSNRNIYIGHTNMKNNQFLMEGNYQINSALGKSIYDNTKMTLSSSTNMIGFDPDNYTMADLQAQGFCCVVQGGE